MDRRTLRVVAVALLAVVALGVAAGTLTSTVSVSDGDGLGGGDQPSVGVDDGDSGVGFGNRTDAGSEGATGPLLELPCYAWLLTGRAVAAVLLGFVLLFSLVSWRYDAVTGAAFVVALAPFAVLAHGLLTGCTDPTAGSGLFPGGGTSPLPEGGGGFGSDDGSSSPSLPSVVLSTLLLLAVAVSAALVVLSTGDESTEREANAAPDDADVARVGRAAGRAADRLADDADPENEIYRAWLAMTRHLDVDRPAASTPAEFAAAATDAGMDPDDVGELTDLFEAVRYGGAAVTSERAERARRALRRIEGEYADR